MSKRKSTKAQLIPQPLKLDLGCGGNKREGFIGVDIAKLPSVDIVQDLTKFPWPFKDNSVDEAHCSHYVEHTPNLMAFMNEVYRILKPGGQIMIIAPYYNSMRCWQDPTHLRAISEATFLYYNKKWRDDNKLGHYPIACDFDYSYGYNISNPRWQTANEEARNFAIRHYVNVVDDIQAVLVKR